MSVETEPRPPEPPDAPQKNTLRRDAWVISCTVITLIAMLVAVTAWAFASSDTSSSSGSGGSSSPGAPQTIDIELGEFYIKPGKVEVPAGTPITFKVTNKGTMQHDFQFGSKKTPMLDAGGTATLDVGAVTQTTKGICTVPGHEAAGMKMQVVVTGAAQTAAPAAKGEAMAGENAPNPNDAKIDPNATAPAGFKAHDPVLQPAAPETVHNVTLNVVDKVLEVAPGVKQMIWTFENGLPGPTLHGKVGDTFNVTLVNKGNMGHSVDFHASETAMDQNMRTIQPGQSLVYTFKAQHSGIWMYHCGTAPTLQHIGNGMYGAVVIDPPNLPKVDKEFVLVQSELYLGPQGQLGDYAKMLSGDYDAVVFNGYYNQYKFDPIKVNPGERVRFWVVDDGPNEISSFHIVGTQFDTVFKEGAYLLKAGNAEQGGAQALDLMPAQGGFVELTVPEVGHYAIVSHKFNDASRGALGTMIAGNPPAMGAPAAPPNSAAAGQGSMDHMAMGH